MAPATIKPSPTAAPPAARRAIGYIRVSEMGGRSGPELHTLEVQRASIERAVVARGWQLVDVVTELNRSGADRGRPEFRAALERLTSREVDAMVVWKVSRFARDLTQAKIDIDAILEAGADLIAGDEPFDTSSPQGRLMLNMLLSFAEYEREVLGEQFEVIKERVLERGSHLGRVPFGYLKVRSSPRGNGDVDLDAARNILRVRGSDRDPIPGGLVPHLRQAPVVVAMFEARAARASIADLQRLAEVAGVSETLMSATQVNRTLSLRTYLGEVRQGTRVNADAHEPLVTSELFASVQRIEKGVVKRALEPFALTGVVYCAGCSYRMSGGNQRQPNGGRTRVYRCPGRRGTGRCPAPAVMTADNLQGVVWRRATAMSNLRADLTAPSDAAERLRLLDVAIGEADQALAELGSLSMRNALGDDWVPSMRRVRTEKEELLRTRDAVEAIVAPTLELPFAEMDPDLRESALRGAITAVFVRRRGPSVRSSDDRVHVVWKGDPVPPLGGPRSRISVRAFDFPTHHGGDPPAP